jgi:alpha-N-arabinofuranosidase
LDIWSGLWLDGTVILEKDLAPYVQSALDQLEFLMGNKSTQYGALRHQLGYPKPWKIKYVEVGNEDNLNNGYNSYNGYRFFAFYKAILDAYPDMSIISSTIDVNPKPGNSLQDYHVYALPDYLISQFNFFDHFSADHKTIVGEFACVHTPQWLGRVAEAIFAIGLERNSDKILGVSYAPTMQNLNAYDGVGNLAF